MLVIAAWMSLETPCLFIRSYLPGFLFLNYFLQTHRAALVERARLFHCSRHVLELPSASPAVLMWGRSCRGRFGWSPELGCLLLQRPQDVACAGRTHVSFSELEESLG